MRLPQRRSVRLAAAAPVLVLALAACSSHDEASSSKTSAPAAKTSDTAYPGRTATQVMSSARRAANHAKGVTVSGSRTTGDKKVTFKLAQSYGTGFGGYVAVNGAAIKVRKIGGTTFAQPSPEFLTSMGPMASTLSAAFGSRWVAADPTSLQALTILASAAVIEPLQSFPTTKSVLANTVPDGAKLERVPGVPVNGVATTGIRFTAPMPIQSATLITSAGGTPPTTLTGTVYVAASGRPYPLAIETNAGLDITLSGWNKRITVSAPTKQQTVSLAALGFDPSAS